MYSGGTVLNINLLYSEIPSMPDKIHISYLYSDIEPFKAVNVSFSLYGFFRSTPGTGLISLAGETRGNLDPGM